MTLIVLKYIMKGIIRYGTSMTINCAYVYFYLINEFFYFLFIFAILRTFMNAFLFG